MEQDEARAKREEFERVRLETLADQRRLDKEISEMKKAEAREKIKVMHDKVKSDFENSGFYKKSKRLANISRSGSSKGVPGFSLGKPAPEAAWGAGLYVNLVMSLRLAPGACFAP